MADVRLENVTKKFRHVTALKHVSFEVFDGEFFVLLGPTGAGKTTTLRVVAGLEKQNEGSVYFDNEPVDAESPAARDVAFVFQQYSLYPNMSVFENLAFPLRSPLRRMPQAEIHERVTTAAQLLRITHLLERKTARLSGGEMQRVSIGRAIVREPRVFLMDEPLSNLDAKLRESLRVELKHIQKTNSSTILFVTHDQVEALTLADRIAVLQHGQIVQVGAPRDIYDRPATIFVAQLVGTPRMNLVEATYDEGTLHLVGSQVRLQVDSAGTLPGSLLFGVRPEDVMPDQDGAFGGEVRLVEPLGSETIIHIKSGEKVLQSVVPGMAGWRLGDTIRFNLVSERLHYFALDGRRL
jgi:multiple sugar transport system ATP-binding protein